jgi:hypothetical protein
MTTALTFQNTNFDVIEKNNQIWLTASQIGTALGYVREDSVTRIYNRNKDEFSNAMTENVKLTVSGNYQKTVRLFSLRGAHLIAMFARTALAKQFRKWVLDVLDKETHQIPAIIQPQSCNLTQPTNWPTSYRSDWNRASFPMIGGTANYITFKITEINQRYCASFCFADSHRTPLYIGRQLGDFGYFESSSIEDLWTQVIRFCARCNSRCAFF